MRKPSSELIKFIDLEPNAVFQFIKLGGRFRPGAETFRKKGSGAYFSLKDGKTQPVPSVFCYVAVPE